MSDALFESSLSGLKLLNRGKVRDIYEVDDKHLLIVTTDRLSAFDVILPSPIPGKGAVLTSVSNFWFDWGKEIIPNHLSDLPLEEVLPDAADREHARAVRPVGDLAQAAARPWESMNKITPISKELIRLLIQKITSGDKTLIEAWQFVIWKLAEMKIRKKRQSCLRID